MATKKSKLFWTWLGVEVVSAVWFGWQLANAEVRPWSRRKAVR